MILKFLSRFWSKKYRRSYRIKIYKTYRTVSKASLDTLWQKIIHVADVSWHPLFNSTDLPQGLTAKPGLFYQVVTQLTPIPVKLFVESVKPKELLSIRVLAIPGLEQRITYQVESTLYGTYLVCSIALKGWLSPLMWWWIRPYCDRVASDLAHAVETLD